jgi:short-subunit dehydrogenase involved in D-alanine esterification of teichoic acids
MIPTKAYAVHNATGDPLRNNSVPVGPGATASRTARALQLSPNSLVKQYPELNVLINNAGIMKVDNVHNPVDDALISSIVTTNLLGPIRMTSALIEHLKQQPAA